MALLPRTHAIPKRLYTSTPRTGPSTRPMFHDAELKPIAPPSSAAGTSSGRMAWNDGNPSANTQPLASE